MNRYLFLGLQYDNNREKEYLALSKNGLSAASNEYQWNICEGMRLHLGNSFEMVTALPVGCFPKHYRKACLKDEEWKYQEVNVTEIGCWNFPILKQTERMIKCYAKLKEWLNRTPEDEHIVIIYSLYLPYLQAVSKLKRKEASLKTVLIIPDMPGKYGILPKNRIRAIMATMIGSCVLTLAKNFDEFVVLTEHMVKPLKIKDKPYVVVEGICSEKIQHSVENIDDKQQRYFFYGGTLNGQYGLRNLLDAFDMLGDKQVELWICGSGEMEEEIIDRAAKNSRIRFWGFRTKNEIREMQSKALALVNPRTNEGEYTKYSFPSKTMGYMASGKPVVMYKLDGIPNEYDPYLIYPENNSVQALTVAMKKVLDMTEADRDDLGKKARDFVLNEKNPKKQVGKVLNMILAHADKTRSNIGL